mmetsp:Transcript_18948/g.38922  ORF Transcript_18948/g.38922 Transcript_18948/m.38922 type:complete len:373 (+) Transcript_18948:686-1804(+)
MHPKLAEGVRVRALGRGDHEHPLEHLGDVPQVEGVVEPCGRRQEVLGDVLVHLDSGRHDALDQVDDALVEFDDVRGEDRVEDELKGGDAGGGDAKDVVVTGEARSDFAPSSARGRRAGEEDGVHNVLPEELVAIVKALVVKVLPEQLDGRLGAVRLYNRHVDIIDEDDELLVGGRSEQVLPLLLHLGLDRGLDDEAARLGGVVDGNAVDAHATGIGEGLELLEKLRNDGRLASSGHAGDKHWFVYLDEALHDVREADGVRGGDDHVEVAHSWGGLEHGDDLGPILELVFRQVDEVIVHRISRRELAVKAVLRETLTDKVVEGSPVLGADGCSKRPDHTERENLLGLRLKLVGVASEVGALGRDEKGLEEDRH